MRSHCFSRNRSIRTLWPLWLAVLVLAPTARAFDRPLAINTVPPGATVFINGVALSSPTPVSIKEQQWKNKDSRVSIRVEMDRYAPAERVIGYEEARLAKTLSVVLELAEIRRDIPVVINTSVPGASALVDGKPAGEVPARQKLVFNRTANSPWSSVTIRVEKAPHYKAVERVIKVDEATAGQKSPNEPWNLTLTLDEIQRDIPIEVTANEPGAIVSVDSKPVGPVPLKHILVFKRGDASVQWPSLKLEVQKEGFEYRPPGAFPEPAFAKVLTVDNATAGKINAEFFLPVRFIAVPVRSLTIVNDRIAVTRTNELAEVSLNEQGRQLTQITKAAADDALMLSRISPVPEQPAQIVYAAPNREVRPATGSTPAPEEIIGSSLWLHTGATQTRLTFEARQYDVDPFVTQDGRWVYFSSDRLRGRSIWRMPASGKGGITKVTGDLGTIDIQPAVSPDNSKLAYVARVPSAAPNTPLQIWIANADGTLPTQMRSGHSPAWSPDGKRIAFVSPEEKIWVMDADGGNQTQLTTGESREAMPVWTPLGKHILYASNQALNELKKNHFDIWRMTAEGSDHTQLTINGSLDASPAVSSDGKFLYFFSNRGPQKAGDEKLQIYRMDLAD